MSVIVESFSLADRDVLRRLAGELAGIAALPTQQARALDWRHLNNLQTTRPLVWITELPWHEMDVTGELTLQAEHPAARQVEQNLRRTLYQWRHLPADMVIDDWLGSPLVIEDSGFGIEEQVSLIRQDEASDIASREFTPQLDSEADIQKIKDPVLRLDTEASQRAYLALAQAVGDLLPVRQVGIVHKWFAPWDELIRWWHPQKALVDLIERPALVHAAIERLIQAHLSRLRQWRELNVLSYTGGNHRVGSGGPGIADDLPAPGFDPCQVRTLDQWGCSTPQIFSDVSPKMHAEFALDYEIRWLSQFGLNYYGCCDALHKKIHLLRRIPKLRKVSVSPWADPQKMAEGIGQEVVLSYKPNPSIFAEEGFNLPAARRALEHALEQMRGCNVEIIMKDISTVRRDPRRLWQWAEMAVDVAHAQ